MKQVQRQWIDPFIEDLKTLEAEKMSAISGAMARDREAVSRIAAALEAGPPDADGVARLAAELKQMLGPALLESEQRRVKLHLILAPLYEHLNQGKAEDWETYLDVILAMRVRVMAEMMGAMRQPPAGPVH